MEKKENKVKDLEVVSRVYLNHTYNTDSLYLIGQNKNPKLFTHETRKTHTYLQVDKFQESHFDEWCDHVASIGINFDGDLDLGGGGIISHKSIEHLSQWGVLLNKFMVAIQDYKNHQKELCNLSQISIESARRFLFLMPILVNYNTRVHIDSSNGCFNIDIRTLEKGTLVSQISENGYIYYSYVDQNEKIYKITGTAKFKVAKDFIKFNKVLNML